MNSSYAFYVLVLVIFGKIWGIVFILLDLVQGNWANDFLPEIYEAARVDGRRRVAMFR